MGKETVKETVTEYIEWSDYWFEDMGNHSKRRVLLVGDSITRGYREFVKKEVGEEIAVDMWASSRGMDNPDYRKELKKVLEEEGLGYDVIHFNAGLHAQHMEDEEYRRLLEETIEYIKSVSGAKLLLADSTPVWEAEKGYENAYNELSGRRNRIVRKIAEEKELTLSPVYDIVYGKKSFRMADGLHYNKAGCRRQGKEIALRIRQAMEEKS